MNSQKLRDPLALVSSNYRERNLQFSGVDENPGELSVPKELRAAVPLLFLFIINYAANYHHHDLP